MKNRAHIHINGDIIGVGLRFLVKQKAQSLALKGQCIQNEKKEIIIDVEGNVNSIDEFLLYIQKGVSPRSKKTALSIELFDDLKGYTSMESDIV